MKTVFEAAGDIRSVDLLAAVVSIWREARSGSVRFTRSTSSAGFDFSEGELVAAFSSDPRFETAAILVRAGKLDGASLERLTVPPGTDAALAALQAGILTRREWKWGEKIRSIEILAELLGWPDGKYLYDGEARPMRGEFSLAVPRLVLELFLRSRDQHLVDHQLGAVDVPLRQSESFDREFATFGLTADAESVVRLIDGRASAAEICGQAPADEFAVRKLLAALTTLGLLTHGEPAHPEISSPHPAAGLHDVLPESEAPAAPPESLIEIEPIETSEEEAPAAVLSAFSEGYQPDAAAPPPESLDDQDRGLNREVGEGAPSWSDASADREWENSSDDLDRELDTTIEPPAASREPRRLGRLLGFVLAVLAIAVVATVLLRGRSGGPETVAVAAPTRARTARSASRPTATLAPTAIPTSAPTPVRIPTPKAAVRPAKAAPARPLAPPGKTESGRSEWLSRAQADRRKLDADRRTRYAIQLELVCEVPSLSEAWKHDRPAGSLWLLKTPHGGRDCFRVLWGRFPSLEAARKAKGGIPPFFLTSSNRPAVVAVR